MKRIILLLLIVFSFQNLCAQGIGSKPPRPPSGPSDEDIDNTFPKKVTSLIKAVREADKKCGSKIPGKSIISIYETLEPLHKSCESDPLKKTYLECVIHPGVKSQLFIIINNIEFPAYLKQEDPKIKEHEIENIKRFFNQLTTDALQDDVG